jgi:hypothetical protein
MTNQSDRQASVRLVTGTTSTYEGDWHSLFTAAGIAAGTFNERLLAWINLKLSPDVYTNLNSAMAAYAAEIGVSNWDSIGDFDAS